MFDLDKRERTVILLLIAALLAGAAVFFYKNSHPVTDIKIKAFEFTDEGMSGGKVDINSADIDMLSALPGVGKAVAGRIIEYRAREGRFFSVDELKKVKGIKSGIFEKIKDRVTVE
jgi:comEA protein